MALFQLANATLNLRTTQESVKLICFGELGQTIFTVTLWSVLILWSLYFMLI